MPNIYGTLATVIADHYFHGTSGSYGALDSYSTVTNVAYGNSVSMVTHPTGIKIDASKTTGTGNGVYKAGAHVQANNLTTKFWLRLA